MGSIEVQEASRISLLGRQTGQAIDHLLARFPFADHAPLQAKDLSNVLPVALKETGEIGTGGDLTTLESSVPFVAALGALPAGVISLGVFKKELQILIHLRLILLGDEQVVALEAPEHGTEVALGMHGIGRDNAILHLESLQPGFDRTDLILFLAHLMLSQDGASTRLIEREQMHRPLFG